MKKPAISQAAPILVYQNDFDTKELAEAAVISILETTDNQEIKRLEGKK